MTHLVKIHPKAHVFVHSTWLISAILHQKRKQYISPHWPGDDNNKNNDDNDDDDVS